MAASDRDRITIAIAAMGGQGGGVLADWLVEMGEQAGYYVQTTSVPGVAQRTGATIYYVELFPRGAGETPPVLALMPVPGDVDVVIAAELVEAGRAVQRGIVTPDRTTLIASDHRQYTMTEKIRMGDGRTSSAAIRRSIGEAAKRLVCFDMQALAETHHTVISATLFGALAGSAVLPFGRERFEAAITGTGKEVDNNLAAFAAAFERAGTTSVSAAEAPPAIATRTSGAQPEIAPLLERLEMHLPAAVHATALAGLRRLLDYQDPAYAAEYLDRLATIQRIDEENGGEAKTWRLTENVARQLALWMSYEDTIRVADLKIRRERFERCREEVKASASEVVHLTEFMHPRVEEVADTLPAGAGRWLLATPWARDLLKKTALRERRVRTSSLSGFLLLYCLSALRRFRRSTYRFPIEQQRIDAWLARIGALAARRYDLALEVTLCQNLIKGYGDTHTRGYRSFELIMDNVDAGAADDAAVNLVRELREAALADEDGKQLQEKLSLVA